jgi:hypothetical protein
VKKVAVSDTDVDPSTAIAVTLQSNPVLEARPPKPTTKGIPPPEND